MTLEDKYIKIRNLFITHPLKTPIDTNMGFISSELFYSRSYIKKLLNQLNELNWVTWEPQIGRGNSSVLIFHKDLSEIRTMLIENLLSEGKIHEALLEVENEESEELKAKFTQLFYSSRFIVDYDEVKNQLYLEIRDIISKDNVDDYCEMVISGIKKTKPNFTLLINGLSEVVNTPDVEERMKPLRDLTVAGQVKAIAVVLGTEPLKTFAEKRLEEMGEYKFFSTIEEARVYLDSLSS